MKRRISDTEKHALAATVHEAYMEIFPTDTVEAKLDALVPGGDAPKPAGVYSKALDAYVERQKRIENYETTT